MPPTCVPHTHARTDRQNTSGSQSASSTGGADPPASTPESFAPVAKSKKESVYFHKQDVSRTVVLMGEPKLMLSNTSSPPPPKRQNNIIMPTLLHTLDMKVYDPQAMQQKELIESEVMLCFFSWIACSHSTHHLLFSLKGVHVRHFFFFLPQAGK